MKQKTDHTKDKNYQKYVNSQDRKRASGIVKELSASPLPMHHRIAAELVTNGNRAPIPAKFNNQLKRRKLAAQMR